jgi:hypothetical protein
LNQIEEEYSVASHKQAIDVSLIDKTIPSDRVVLVQKKFLIAGTRYFLELSHSKRKVHILLFLKKNDPTVFLETSLPVKIADKLLREDDNEAELFIRRISVKYSKI